MLQQFKTSVQQEKIRQTPISTHRKNSEKFLMRERNNYQQLLDLKQEIC